MTRDRAPLITFAACVVVAVVAFAYYAVHRQAIADHRADAQRKAICAILANIPGKVPAEIQRARLVFARPHHPGDCQPIRHPKPAPTSSAATPRPAAGPTFFVVGPRPGQPPRPGPSPSPSPRPTRSPRPTPSPSRSPTPSPSPTCDLQHPLRCLPI